MDTRRTARVILLDREDRILLMKIDAPEVTRPDRPGETGQIWVTLGGRVEEGESVLEAAGREALEETGMRDVEVGPEIWYGEQTLNVREDPTLFKESFVLARCHHESWTDAGWSDSERSAIVRMKWWTLSDLAETTAVIKPPRLSELLQPVVSGAVPDTPLRIALQEP